MSILVLGILALIGYSLFSKGYFRFQPEGKLYESNSNIVYKFLAEKQSETVAKNPCHQTGPEGLDDQKVGRT